MAKKFMEAETVVSGLISTKEEILKKAANELAEVVVNKAKKGEITPSIKKDILNVIRDFSQEDKNEILINMVVAISSSFAGSSNTNNNSSRNTRRDRDDDDYSDMFGNSRSNIFRHR